MPIDFTWLIVLLTAAGWTILFSMFNAPAIRGLRNLGLLACYVLGIVMLFAAGWRAALATWAVLGAATGVLYFLHETAGYLRARKEASMPSVRALFDGLLLWPVMLPEVVEYTLAEIGILKPAVVPAGPSAEEGSLD